MFPNIEISVKFDREDNRSHRSAQGIIPGYRLSSRAEKRELQNARLKRLRLIRIAPLGTVLFGQTT